jgi:hypothetical protein
VEDLLLPALSSYEKHEPSTGSLILLAGQVASYLGPSLTPRLLPRLLLALSPWVTCHVHHVRTFAQLAMCLLLDRFPPQHPVWTHTPGEH